MSQEVQVRPATTSEDMDAVRKLCWAYREYLKNFSEEVRYGITFAYPEAEYAALMDSLETKHARPKGLILLAEIDGQPVGCGMYHSVGEFDAEIKRVFVTEQARGKGSGFKISKALLDNARKDGYKRVFLDTSRQFDGARAMYEKLGFTQRGPYSELPPDFVVLLVFYELNL